MAAIGPGWATAAWIEASWDPDAWGEFVAPVVVVPAPKPSGAGLAFPLPRVEPPRIGRVFSIVGKIRIQFEGSAAISLVQGEVKFLQETKQRMYDDDEEIMAILDDWTD